MSRQAISDLDLWRAANLMVERHGDGAALVAAQRADEMLAQGDTEGQLVWKHILTAVNELQRTKIAANERRH
jgi:hypothetical protein